MKTCKKCKIIIDKKKRSHAIFCSRSCKERYRDQVKIKRSPNMYRKILMEILGKKCWKCGSKKFLEVDHIKPLSKKVKIISKICKFYVVNVIK